MSFTLYKRRMDGEMVPIKMSIWDAFQGAPNPRPKKRDPCACCGKFHGMTDKAKEQAAKDGCVRNGGPVVPVKQIEWNGKNNKSKNDSKDNKNNSGNNNKDDANKKGFSTSEEETYSKQDDIVILSMKGDSRSWKEILEAIGKTSKSQLVAHYKTLEGKPSFDNTDVGKADDGNKKDDKKAKADKDKSEGLKKQAEANKDKGGNGKKGKGKGKGEEKKENSSNAKSDDTAVKAWADRYDKQKWVAMASKHFDKTGQRITPEQARKLADGK